MVRRSVFLVLVSILVSWGGSSASAQDGSPRVYIVSVPMDDDAGALAARAGSAARAALRSVEGVDWRGPDQQYLGYDDSAMNALNRARERLEEGRQAYLDLELDAAVEALEGAVADFDAAAAAMEDPADLGQALLYLGASHAFNGQRRQAIATFRRLHTQMPHIQPDPDTFPPDVIQLYENAAPPDARNPTARVTVDSDPPGAVVYVDYLARGRTPLEVQGLIGGEHIVRVSRPGATPYVEPVRIRRGRMARSDAFLADHDPDLTPLADALARIPASSVERLERDGPIGEIASMLDLSTVGVIRVSSAGESEAALELLLFDVASGRRLLRGQGTVPTEIGALEAGVERLVQGGLEAALRPQQAADTESIIPTEPRPIAPVASTPVYEEWWFWTIIGAVVVGAGVGIGVAIATQDRPLGQDPGGQVIFTF